MESSDKYESEIWLKLSQLPYMVAIGMQGAGKSGIAGSASERHSSLLKILSARAEYPGNPLISSMLPLKDDEETAIMRVMDRHDAALNHLEASGIHTLEALWERILTWVEEVLPAIKKREAGHTLSDYISWLREIALGVANAAKEGDLMGVGGERFSEGERAYFNKLDAALHSFESRF